MESIPLVFEKSGVAIPVVSEIGGYGVAVLCLGIRRPPHFGPRCGLLSRHRSQIRRLTLSGGGYSRAPRSRP